MRKVKIEKIDCNEKYSEETIYCPLTRFPCVSNCAWYSEHIEVDEIINEVYKHAMCKGNPIGELKNLN